MKSFSFLTLALILSSCSGSGGDSSAAAPVNFVADPPAQTGATPQTPSTPAVTTPNSLDYYTGQWRSSDDTNASLVFAADHTFTLSGAMSVVFQNFAQPTSALTCDLTGRMLSIITDGAGQPVQAQVQILTNPQNYPPYLTGVQGCLAPGNYTIGIGARGSGCYVFENFGAVPTAQNYPLLTWCKQ